ncbi:MAG: glycosyltransferase [Acidobacteriota bacterium]
MPGIERLVRPLRVARTIARLNVGGPTRHVVWLTAGLEGPEVHTVLITGTVPAGEDDMTPFATAHGVVPFVIPEMSREISPRDVISVWKFFRFLHRFRPDIVHTHTAKAGTVGRAAGLLYRWLTWKTLIGKPRRVVFVHTFHGHVFHSYYGKLKTRFFILVEKVLARLATDVIITISEQQRHEIHQTFGIGRAEQFRVIPLGVELDVPGERAPTPPVEVAIVGRLVPIKNHELFLRVIAAREWPAPVRFVVYGDGAERAALEQRATALGLAGRIRFAGTRPAAEIYPAAGIVALTSLNEGTPLTLIEAMLAGVPVISTAVGGVPDVLGPVEERVQAEGAVYEIRERGLSAASNDVAGFAAGLSRLLADGELRERLTRRGRDFAATAYSKDRLLTDIIALYRELHDAPRS